LSDEDYYPDINSLEKNKDVEGLIRALEHKEYLIRKEAARSLKKVGDQRAVEPLIRALKYESCQSNDPILSTVREYSAEALSLIGDTRALLPLIQAVNEDTDEEVRWKAVYALGKIGDESAVEALNEALKSNSWIVRENAAKALGNIGSPASVEPLIDALEDKEWRVRKYSVLALGKIGDERSITPLLNLLNDEDTDVRRKTIETLGNMGDAAFKPLMDLFWDKDWYIRSKAAEVLGIIGDRRAVKPFIDTLSNKRKDDRNRYVRGRVAEALGKIGDVRAIDALIRALEDNTIFVRQKAEEALIRIRSLEYPGKFVQFNNGSISFNYPENWTIKTLVTDEKFEGYNSDHNIKLIINKKSNLEEISLKELIKIWEDIFLHQNIEITSKISSHLGNTEAFLMTGDSLDTDNIIMIVGFKLYDMFYYLHFTIKSPLSENNQGDIDLIVNTFRIYVSYI
jgi:HEAT repeat protein